MFYQSTYSFEWTISQENLLEILFGLQEIERLNFLTEEENEEPNFQLKLELALFSDKLILYHQFAYLTVIRLKDSQHVIVP